MRHSYATVSRNQVPCLALSRDVWDTLIKAQSRTKRYEPVDWDYELNVYFWLPCQDMLGEDSHIF